MLDRLEDTIVAISSAPGTGRVGVVRLSGSGAFSIADQLVRLTGEARLSEHAGSTRVDGEIRLSDDLDLPASFYLFRAPRSYTRQDLIEIHTIGSAPALDQVRERALSLGARPAQAGEFTARAFLNGAMDLASAEAVAYVIRAESDTQLRAARRLSDGEFHGKLLNIRDELAELLALVEADIDFAEEPIEFIAPGELAVRLYGIGRELRSLGSVPTTVERLDALPRILLFGPPNAGKSSLMNRLSGTRRAICAAAAGTTRDILSAPIRLGRREAILLDAAGVETTENEVIARALTMTIASAERADVVCLVLDITAGDRGDACTMVRSMDLRRLVIVANKTDLTSPEQAAGVLDAMRGWKLGPVLAVSALTGSGMDELRMSLRDTLGADETTTSREAIVLTERQRAAVSYADEAVRRAMVLSDEAVETIDCADLLAFELREALDALGTVTGEVATEDLLGRVFARFCIGK